MAIYRKKPVKIEAFKWTGGPDQVEDPIWIKAEIECGNVRFDKGLDDECIMVIRTLEGLMSASPGDYIIKGIKGEIYPCKPDIFEATYDFVGEGAA